MRIFGCLTLFVAWIVLVNVDSIMRTDLGAYIFIGGVLVWWSLLAWFVIRIIRALFQGFTLLDRASRKH